MSRINWDALVPEATAIVESYDTGVTLRQLFYRLVASEQLPNTSTAYKGLSRVTAAARREGRFPKLIDPTRTINRLTAFPDPDTARDWLADIYRRDRTEGQDATVYLGVEKAGILEQLKAWFGDYGVPIVALRGYSSQSFVEEVRRDVERYGRPGVLLYAGDFDPSGMDILRDFLERTDCFGRVDRIALNSEQIETYNLPPLPGKATDSRAAGFIGQYGRLVQVELDALPPEILRGLYEDAFGRYWDVSTFEGVRERERAERDLPFDACLCVVAVEELVFLVELVLAAPGTPIDKSRS